MLDSILKNYPVGSLLLWRTSKKLATERNIGDFKLPSTEELSPTNYVLDGQQRLTVIYSCLGATDDKGGFVAIYNLIEYVISAGRSDARRVAWLRAGHQGNWTLSWSAQRGAARA